MPVRERTHHKEERGVVGGLGHKLLGEAAIGRQEGRHVKGGEAGRVRFSRWREGQTGTFSFTIRGAETERPTRRVPGGIYLVTGCLMTCETWGGKGAKAKYRLEGDNFRSPRVGDENRACLEQLVGAVGRPDGQLLKELHHEAAEAAEGAGQPDLGIDLYDK